jgi:hypothetical protein
MVLWFRAVFQGTTPFPRARHFVVRGRLHRVSYDLGGLGMLWSVHIAHHHGIIPQKRQISMVNP